MIVFAGNIKNEEAASMSSDSSASDTATAAATATTATTTAAGTHLLSSPLNVGDADHISDDDLTKDDDDDEPTGRTLWDCAKVLYDLVAIPDPANVFSVRGKVTSGTLRNSVPYYWREPPRGVYCIALHFCSFGSKRV